MAWKSDKSPGARRAKRAMLARREARTAFKRSMEVAFELCNGYLNAKGNKHTEKMLVKDFKDKLTSDFSLYAYHSFRELRHKEKMPKKYSDMADLYREICLSQDSCAEARESLQGLRFVCAQVVKGCGSVR